MVSFFEKKATAAEIATALLQIPASDLSSILETMPSGVDRQCAQDEFRYLLTFVVDFATSITLGDKPEAKAILDVYYFRLKSTLDATVYKKLYERINVYTNAVNTPHQNGPAWTVGIAFARFCGFQLDIQMTMAGSTVFGNYLKQVSEFLKSYEIIV